MDKKLELCLLLDIYGKLLTSKQADILHLYLEEDLSLSEISENLGISRQGAWRFIEAATRKLLRFESALELSRKHQQHTKAITRINSLIQDAYKFAYPELNQILTDIQHQLNQL